MNKCSRLLGWRHLAVGIAYCQTKATNPDEVEQPIVIELNQIAEKLTHKYLLQQTCTISVNSSCQMITIALVALNDASKKYKDELIKGMDLLEPNDLFDEKSENDFMESRYDITNAKSFYLDSISSMDCALQLGRSNALMSHTVEANTVLNIMSEKLYSAEREFQSCVEEIRKLEEKFTKLLADSVKTSKNEDS
uniref:Diablo homolog, mitochondrial n=1 Tax=Schizaphis graminum TaxID=13262 RepID=A0A2S2P432_SCHGA